MPAEEDPRLIELTEICLGLPEATRTLAGAHAQFQVRSRTFAYFLDDHHGDGIVGLTCKAAPGEADALIASEPDRFYRPDYLGHKGWVAFRLDEGEPDWNEVAGLALTSYLLVAPKALAERATA